MLDLPAVLDVDEGEMLQPVAAAGNYRLHIGIRHPADAVVGRVGHRAPGDANLSRVAGVLRRNVARSNQIALRMSHGIHVGGQQRRQNRQSNGDYSLFHAHILASG